MEEAGEGAGGEQESHPKKGQGEFGPGGGAGEVTGGWTVGSWESDRGTRWPSPLLAPRPLFAAAPTRTLPRRTELAFVSPERRKERGRSPLLPCPEDSAVQPPTPSDPGVPAPGPRGVGGAPGARSEAAPAAPSRSRRRSSRRTRCPSAAPSPEAAVPTPAAFPQWELSGPDAPPTVGAWPLSPPPSPLRRFSLAIRPARPAQCQEGL